MREQLTGPPPDESAAGVDFDADPLAYPGSVIRAAMLLLPTCHHAITLSAGEPGDAVVVACEVCAARGEAPGSRLDDVLDRRRLPSIDARSPVVAIGSNASAAVLRGKLRRAGADVTVPTFPGHVDNILAAHSAHVARPGFVPAAPARVDGARTSVMVAWLDAAQRRAIDATEPNYRRVRVLARDCPVAIGLRAPTAFWVYASRWGVLGDPEPVALRSQTDIARWLSERLIEPWLSHDPAAAARRLGSTASMRDGVREQLRVDGIASHAYDLAP